MGRLIASKQRTISESIGLQLIYALWSHQQPGAPYGCIGLRSNSVEYRLCDYFKGLYDHCIFQFER